MPLKQQHVSNLNAEGLSVNRLQMLHQQILGWYDTHHRHLPWRAPIGKQANPYHVLVSEVMLQQTTVPTVKQYFINFMKHWPTIQDLAKASEDEILTAWQGLGYYRRARLLLRCAQHIAQYKSWPEKADELIKLPGLGEYTALAIAAIAFNEDVIPLDGNIIRVLGRFSGLIDTKERLKRMIQGNSVNFKGFKRSGDFCQALMDLGSMVCKPSNPDCARCPLNNDCIGFKNNTATLIPLKVQKTKRKLFTNAYCIVWNDKIFLQKNTSTTLLKNMMLPPMDPWTEEEQKTNLLHLNWKEMGQPLKHVFTHIELHVRVHIATVNHKEIPIKGNFVAIESLPEWPLATLTKKIIQQAL